jgi:hypothetical protein
MTWVGEVGGVRGEQAGCLQAGMAGGVFRRWADHLPSRSCEQGPRLLGLKDG